MGCEHGDVGVRVEKVKGGCLRKNITSMYVACFMVSDELFSMADRMRGYRV